MKIIGNSILGLIPMVLTIYFITLIFGTSFVDFMKYIFSSGNILNWIGIIFLILMSYPVGLEITNPLKELNTKHN